MISIIIPVLNEAHNIAACLQQFRHFTEQHELIVVDGGSRDDSIGVVLDDAHVVCAPAGRARQMNAGAAQAQGDILLFLHADTLLPANALSSILAAVARGTGWGRFDVRLTGRHPLLRVIAAMMNLRSRITSVATGDQAIFVRRDVFDAAGGFDDIPLMEDIAMSKKLRRRSRCACIRSAVLTSSRRWQQHGVLRTVLSMWWLRLQYFLGVSPNKLAEQYYPVTQGERLLIVFAKAPVAGTVNTRLVPNIGEAGAAQLQHELIELRMHQFADRGQLDVQLCCSPDTTHDLFQRCARQYRVSLEQQHGDDLGSRMAHALREGLRRYHRVVLIGTDAPAVDREVVDEAFASLEDHRVVLQPAEDGGYVLIGMSEFVPCFDGVHWGTELVMQQTEERLAALGVEWHRMQTGWDIDTPEDLHRYRNQP